MYQSVLGPLSAIRTVRFASMWAESSAFISEALDYALFLAFATTFFPSFLGNRGKMGADIQEISLAAVLPQFLGYQPRDLAGHSGGLLRI